MSSGDAPAVKGGSAGGGNSGIATPQELQAFVDGAGEALVVIDLRNPDATVEPDDQATLAVAGLPSASSRPSAVNVVWDRKSHSLPLLPSSASSDASAAAADDADAASLLLLRLPKDTPIITHCGAGGRGQMAKEYLMDQHGFTNVLNGGGPKVTECWKIFGNK
jgi:rhodanese-related sulfurtransferase